MKIADITPGEVYYIEGVSGWDRDWDYRVPDGYDRGGYATVAEDQTDAYIEAGPSQWRRTGQRQRRGVRVIWPADERWGEAEEVTVVVPAKRVIATAEDYRARVEAEAQAKRERIEAEQNRQARVREEGDALAARCEELNIPYWQDYNGEVRLTLTTEQIIELVAQVGGLEEDEEL